jgi:predicted RNA polymerase sigma factor
MAGSSSVSNLAVDHLFRQQSGKMMATLTRVFGSRRLDLAEEVVQDALVKALELWPFQGVPENPMAWLVQVAKNRALDVIRREASLAEKIPELGGRFQSSWSLALPIPISSPTISWP